MYTISDNTDGAPVLAVTSTNENAGKSTIIVNLAISFAQLDKKVLLIDGDMRCPVVHRHFEMESHDKGLSEVISGIETDVINHDVRPGLDVITSGRIPPNPSELITSPKFTELLNNWKQQYDIIFIDFPPIGVVTDSLAACKNVNGYVFVVRAGSSSAKSINSAISAIEQVGAKIVGVVLNDYNMKGARRYKHVSSHYSRKATSRYESASKKSK
jgi:capsular exopolysaccharide synthesis family protein